MIKNRDSTIKAQQRRLEDLIKRIYGRRSEKLDPKQFVFDELILEADKYKRPQEPVAPR